MGPSTRGSRSVRFYANTLGNMMTGLEESICEGDNQEAYHVLEKGITISAPRCSSNRSAVSLGVMTIREGYRP